MIAMQLQCHYLPLLKLLSAMMVKESLFTMAILSAMAVKKSLSVMLEEVTISNVNFAVGGVAFGNI